MKLFIKSIFAFLLFFAGATAVGQNSVTEIVTDFGGYWMSGSSSINAIKPNNSHNLVSFTYSGQRYSTGVDDALLASKGLSFIPGDYRALPMESITGAVTSNTKVGLGEMYDGITNGPSVPAPLNSISKYLTDGKKGLDIGTCIANLPAGNMFFPASRMKIAAIGDGIPDLVITQTADPSSSSLDKYEFTDINGVRVGNSLDIVLNTIAPVGNWTADFYEASAIPLNLLLGFTKTDRPIRLWSADFSAFGIDASNISQVAYFKITLNGNSDVAFVAYNANTMDISSSLLPTTLKSFTAKVDQKKVSLNWETVTEINSKEFVVEASCNDATFKAIGSLTAAGNSFHALNYQFNSADLSSGKWLFRLKMVDGNGHSSYSSVQAVNLSAQGNTQTVSLYPNPATNYVLISHPPAGSKQTLEVWNMQGVLIQKVQVKSESTQTRIELGHQQPGMYQVKMNDAMNKVVKTLIVQ